MMRTTPLQGRIDVLKASMPFSANDEQGVSHPLEDFERGWKETMAAVVIWEPHLYLLNDGWEVSAEWPVDVGNHGGGEVSLTLGIEGLWEVYAMYFGGGRSRDAVYGWNELEECAHWIRSTLDEMSAA